MPTVVYRMLTLLCAVVMVVPIGTNLALLHLLWMLVSQGLLPSRGALSRPGATGTLPQRRAPRLDRPRLWRLEYGLAPLRLAAAGGRRRALGLP